MVDREDTQTPTPLADFGNLLREKRVRRGYTVEEVASQLKITSRMVRAIEDGDVASLPHAVYARGFIRAYAKLLGMGEEEVRPACSALVDTDENAPQEPFTAPSRPRKRSGGGLWWYVLLLCLLLGGGYWAYTHEFHLRLLQMTGPGAERATPALPATPAGLTGPTENNPGSSVMSLPSGTGGRTGLSDDLRSRESTGAVRGLPGPDGQAGQTGQGAASDSPVAGPDRVRVLPAPSASPAEAAPLALAQEAPSAVADTASGAESLTLQTGSGAGTPIAPGSSGKRHQIILTALAECWVHSSADDMDTRQLSIQKGETFALSFDRKLVVKLGNAGGVRIKYDGKELPPAGKAGQVKTLIFPQAAGD